MDIATLTSKGQVTLPARVREKLRLVAGSKIAFDEQPNGDFLVRRKAGDIRALRGILQAPEGIVASIEDMDRAIGEEMAAKLARCR